jgi:hypothetical protein
VRRFGSAGSRREHNLEGLLPKESVGIHQVELRLNQQPPGIRGVKLWARTTEGKPVGQPTWLLNEPPLLLCLGCQVRLSREGQWAAIGAQPPL